MNNDAHVSQSSPSRSTSAVAEELAASQGAARTILEGDLINLNATAPSACIALGLMYLKSENERIANTFYIPGANIFFRFSDFHPQLNRLTNSFNLILFICRLFVRAQNGESRASMHTGINEELGHVGQYQGLENLDRGTITSNSEGVF